MTVRLGTRVPDISVGLGAAILSEGGGETPAATMPNTALYLPGTFGNYVSTPSAASLDITSDMGSIVHFSMDDWTPATIQTVYGKYDGTTVSYQMYVATTGSLVFGSGTDNYSNSNTNFSSKAPGDDLWIATALDISLNYCQFWTSSDGVTWTDISGSTVAITGIAVTTAPLEIGSRNGGLLPLAGNVHYVAIYNGIGAGTAPGQGTLVYEADFSHPWVGNRYTDSTGKVSTINGSAWAWEIPE